jgi:hypothetical protein
MSMFSFWIFSSSARRSADLSSSCVMTTNRSGRSRREDAFGGPGWICFEVLVEGAHFGFVGFLDFGTEFGEGGSFDFHGAFYDI